MSSLDRVRQLARRVSIPFEDGELEFASGKKIAVVALHHGAHYVLAYPDRNQIVLAVPVAVPEEPRKKLASLPREARNKFFAALRREVLEGRTGFVMTWEDGKVNESLQELRLEQRLSFLEQDNAAAQRLLDGKQELVTLASRALSLFSMTFDSMGTGASDGTSPDGMYH